ncbi:MAG: Cof-type HAD-IIB family hydrolase [Cetobacterium sp.]
MKKIIFCDLDGTLLNEEKEISPLNKKVIQDLYEKNIEFIITTGRGYSRTKNYRDLLEINCEVICNNGSTIYNISGEKIFEKTIPIETSQELIDFFILRNINFLGNSGDFMYTSIETEKNLKKHFKSFPENIVILPLDKLKNIIFEKIVILDEDYKNLKNWENILNFKFSSVIRTFISQSNFLDIVSKECSKGIAMEFLAKQKGFSLNETLAFGDAYNDFEMLSMAGEGVIMDNGFEELKKIIKNRTHSNNNDGVAKYLIKHFGL